MLKDYLPQRLSAIEEIAALQDCMQPLVDEVVAARQDFFNQLFVATATWGLGLWELEYGILPDTSSSYEVRRQGILVKMLGAATVTVIQVQEVVFACLGVVPEVVELFGEYTIKILHRKHGGFSNDSIINALTNIVPAHLKIEIAYKGLTVGEVQRMTVMQMDQQQIFKLMSEV